MRKVAPKFMDPQYERRVRVKDSQRQEKRIAGIGAGVRVRGSGSKPHARGDVRWDKYGLLIEAKRTDKGSISIKGSVLDKITREAMANGKTPAVAIEVTTELAERDWLLLPATLAERILEAMGTDHDL